MFDFFKKIEKLMVAKQAQNNNGSTCLLIRFLEFCSYFLFSESIITVTKEFRVGNV
jgi:hypothetical protein